MREKYILEGKLSINGIARDDHLPFGLDLSRDVNGSIVIFDSKLKTLEYFSIDRKIDHGDGTTTIQTMGNIEVTTQTDDIKLAQQLVSQQASTLKSNKSSSRELSDLYRNKRAYMVR